MNSNENNFDQLVQRYIDGTYTGKDARAILNASKTSAGAADIEKKMDEIIDESFQTGISAENYQLYKKEAELLLKRIQRQEKRFRIRPFMKYAAGVAILIGMGLGAFFMTKNITPTAEEQIYYVDVVVKNGEQQEVWLPDSTLVTLNAGSFLRYPTQFTPDVRLVEIDGEGFFDVKKKKNHPFIIRTRQADIKVLGTSFNVKAYNSDEQLSVSVIEGKVQVEMPDAMIRIVRNEQLLIDKNNGEFQKRSEDADRIVSWMEGGLYFNKTPVRGVIKELERIYDCKIEMAPGFVYDEYIYGEHDNRSLQTVLNSLEYATGIKHRKEGDTYVLYR